MPAIIQAFPKEWRPGPDSTFRLKANSLVDAGGINPGAPNIYGPLAQVWTCSIPVPLMNRRQWQGMSAFFSRLAGMSGFVRMFDPKRVRPGQDISAKRTTEPFDDGEYFSDGSGFGSGFAMPPFCEVYEAASAGDDSVILAGLPESKDAALWAGDLIEFRPDGIPASHGFLHEVYGDAPTDANGRTRVYLNPPLRRGLGAGDMAVLHWPTSVFRAIDDDQGILAHAMGGVASAGFALIELMP